MNKEKDGEAFIVRDEEVKYCFVGVLPSPPYISRRRPYRAGVLVNFGPLTFLFCPALVLCPLCSFCVPPPPPPLRF
jgi:hypothetical protein